MMIPLKRMTLPYLGMALFTGYMLWTCTRQFLFFIPFWPFIAVYMGVAFFVIAAKYLPDSKLRVLLDKLGNYWACLQFTLFIGALIDLPLKVLFLTLLKVQAVKYALFSAALYTGVILLTLYGILHGRKVHCQEYPCHTGKLSTPLRIVHLSDLHLGGVNDLPAIEQVVQRVNRLSPDMICITGDTFTESFSSVPYVHEMGAALKKLKSPLGTYACLGNHDSGHELPRMIAFFREADIHLLQDQALQLNTPTGEPFSLIGRLDPTPGGQSGDFRKSLAELTQEVPARAALMVMDHQPTEISQAEKAGVDLLLCGHTHGGQFFPVHLIIRKLFPHYTGCKSHGKMYAVVSPGTCAAIPPVRIGSRSEIVSIHFS